MPPLQVVEQPQPYGEQGVRFSLDEVARRAAKGGLDARVRAWAIEQLERARREQGIRADNDRERATVLLKSVQKKLWVPDPVGAEWMAGAHLLACDVSSPDSICMHGSDCDDLSILLGACLLGVGIYVAVVGHAYNGSSSIGHVLLAAWVDGQWEYADPSTDLALGKCVKFSRERLISVPNVKVICDSNVCLRERTDYHPEKNDFVVKGVFVGVDGPPLSPPKFFWNANASALGQENDDPYQKCIDSVVKADLDTAAGRKQASEQAARCAADAYCAVYKVPPGICSSVAGPIAREVVGFFSDLFGGDAGVKCGNTFDPCHPCAWVRRMGKDESIFGSGPGSIINYTGYDAWTKSDPKCRAWLAGAPERLKSRVDRAALDALVTRYENTWAWALTIKSGKPNYAALQADHALLESTKAALIAKGAQVLSSADLERASRGDTTVTPVISQAIESVNQASGFSSSKSKKSSSLVPLALVGAAAGGLWWLSKR